MAYLDVFFQYIYVYMFIYLLFSGGFNMILLANVLQMEGLDTINQSKLFTFDKHIVQVNKSLTPSVLLWCAIMFGILSVLVLIFINEITVNITVFLWRKPENMTCTFLYQRYLVVFTPFGSSKVLLYCCLQFEECSAALIVNECSSLACRCSSYGSE